MFRLAGLELDLVRHRAMRDGRRLRSKVNDPYPRKLIHTVRRTGYVLEER